MKRRICARYLRGGLRRLFPVEEINGGKRCPTYLYRWVLLPRWANRWCQVYLHHFVGDDWSRDLHDHPKRFISIGLRGSYDEWTPCRVPGHGCDGIPRTFRAPWIRTFPATHIHRITTPTRSCWTLVIVLHATRDWGFWNTGQWIPWRTYLKSTTADARKACQ